MIAMMLLLAWLPASTHCLLAAVLQNAAVSGCCIESKQAQNADTHHNSDCCPFCDTFESGKILALSTKDNQDAADGVAEMLPFVVVLRWLPESNPAPSFNPHESPSEAATWQFETRSARLGRSPNVSF